MIMQGLECLQELLERWKASELEYYSSFKIRYDALLAQYEGYKQQYGEKIVRQGFDFENSRSIFNWPNEGISLHNYIVNDSFFDEYKLKGYDKSLVKCFSMDEIIKKLERECEIQYQVFINRVEAKGGKIINVVYCRWNGKGNIDGLILCENNTVEINTIIAGGYNIQRLHYRTLINVRKVKEVV